ASVQRALARMMPQREPSPLVVFDRRYDVLRTNQGAARLLPQLVADPQALTPPVNALILLFDPRLTRPFVEDWATVAHATLARLHREVLAKGGDAELTGLLNRLLEFPGVPASWRQPDFSLPSEPTLPVRLRRGDFRVSFLTTV